MNIKMSVIFLALLICPNFVFAALQVFPTRVLLNDKTKSGQVSLRHQGTTAKRYRISAVYYEMSEDGAMTQLKNPSDIKTSAIPYFKFSPRLVTLQPNVEQVVRVLTSAPKELPAGDYRAHLYFEEADDPVVPEASAEANVAKMELSARLAIAVPVIIRKGEPAGEVKLANLKIVTLPDQKKAFSVEIHRSGDKFAYGDFRVYFKDRTGKELLIGVVNGVSSYINKRRAIYPLEPSAQKDFNNGSLRADYLESASDGKIMATTQVEIGN